MKIAALPGDGIGVEIVAEAVRVLERLRADGMDLAIESAPIGGAGYDAAGKPLPDATLELASRADAILLGAVCGPRYDALPRESAEADARVCLARVPPCQAGAFPRLDRLRVWGSSKRDRSILLSGR